MLALLDFKNQNPSPWSQRKTFYEFLEMLLCSKSCLSGNGIRPNENILESNSFINEERIRHQQRIAEMEEQAKLQQHYYEMAARFDTDVSTGPESKQLLRKARPLKNTLYPYQKQLKTVCWAIRVLQNVLTWKDSYYSFWITASSLLL